MAYKVTGLQLLSKKNKSAGWQNVRKDGLCLSGLLIHQNVKSKLVKANTGKVVRL